MVWRISGVAHAALDRGVGAGEHQREAAVGDGPRRLGSGFDFVGDQLQVLLARGAGLPAAHGVGLAAAGDRQQPGVGIVAGRRPSGHMRSAVAKASASASSAPATSRVRAARKATRRP